MSGRAGRQVRFNFGGESPADEIPGVRQKSLDLNGEPIDITSDESAGVRELLTLSAQDEVNIGISGVTKSDRIKAAWFSGQRTQPCSLDYPDGSSVSGTFFLSTFKETEGYKDATTFEATLASTGAVTYTPAP